MSQPTQIRLSGAGGQGLQLAASILAEALLREGRTLAQSQSYEPTSRGGVSRSDLVVGNTAIDYPLITALDFLVVLDDVAASASTILLRPGSVVLIDSARVPNAPEGAWTTYRFACTDIARSLGNERVANIVALGALTALGGLCPTATLQAVLHEETPEKFLALNLEALSAGTRLADGLTESTAALFTA